MLSAGNNNVVEAAQWLADQKEPPARVVPVLREKFLLNTAEACEAAALASRFRVVRRAFG